MNSATNAGSGLLSGSRVPTHASSARHSRGWFKILGALSFFQLFATVDIFGVPVSLLWLASLAAARKTPKTIPKVYLVFGLMVVFLLFKLIFGGSTSVLLKFSVGVLFLFCLQVLERQEWLAFLEGLKIGGAISLIVALVQFVLMIVIGDGAISWLTVPVQLWNSSGWHGLLFDNNGWPRVTALMFEPAYYAAMSCMLLLFELVLNEKPRKSIVFITLLGVALANSRTGALSWLFVFSLGYFKYFNKRWIYVIAYLLTLTLPILPIFKMYDGIVNYDQSSSIDISVFARYISFAAFGDQDVAGLLFGPASYTKFYSTNELLQSYSPLLDEQGSAADPKSILASNLYLFGILGFSFISFALLKLTWHQRKTIYTLACANLIFFNVYPYSWPTYWIVLAIGIFLLKGNKKNYGNPV